MVEIFSVTPDDINELSLFLSNFPNETRKQEFWLDRFILWWDNNPAFSTNIERGWILREKGKIVGFLGTIPTSFQLFGEKVRALNTTTWEVLPEYRNESIRLLFKLINVSKDTILFNTSPNKEVVKIIKALKFKLLPGGRNTQNKRKASIEILNFENVLRSKLGSNYFSWLITIFCAPILKILQYFCLRKFKKSELTNVRQVIKADSLFDQLWERTKNIYPNTNIRTADIINWHCFEMKGFEKKLFGYYKNNQLLGYIVCRSRNPKNLRIFECLDLWFDPTAKHVIESLINYTIKYARENSLDIIILPHFNGKIGEYCRRLGLLNVKLPCEKYFKVKANMNGKINEKNSYFTGSQGDSSL